MDPPADSRDVDGRDLLVPPKVMSSLLLLSSSSSSCAPSDEPASRRGQKRRASDVAVGDAAGHPTASRDPKRPRGSTELPVEMWSLVMSFLEPIYDLVYAGQVCSSAASASRGVHPASFSLRALARPLSVGSLVSGLSRWPLDRLRVLALDMYAGKLAPALELVVACAPPLERVSLCGTSVGDAALLKLLRACGASVRVLELRGCERLRSALRQAAADLPALEHLDVSDCRVLRLTELLAAGPPLVHLDASMVPLTTLDMFLIGDRLGTTLRKLVLRGCSVSQGGRLPADLGRGGHALLDEVVPRCRALEWLDVAGCASVRDLRCDFPSLWYLSAIRSGLRRLSGAWPGLRELYASWTPLEGDSLVALCRSAGHRLQRMELSGTPLTPEDVSEARRYLSSGCLVDLSSCRSLPRSWRRPGSFQQALGQPDDSDHDS